MAPGSVEVTRRPESSKELRGKQPPRVGISSPSSSLQPQRRATMERHSTCWADTLHSSPKGGMRGGPGKGEDGGPRGSSRCPPHPQTPPRSGLLVHSSCSCFFIHSLIHSFTLEYLLHRLATGQAAVVRQWPCLPPNGGGREECGQIIKATSSGETDTGPRQEDMEAKSWTAR